METPFYLHTAPDGHKNQLLQENNKVALNIYQFLDRVGYKKAQYLLRTMEDVEIPRMA